MDPESIAFVRKSVVIGDNPRFTGMPEEEQAPASEQP